MLAMSPISNIGSSSPIDSSGQDIGGDLRKKIRNDAAASLTALAAEHKRNIDLARQGRPGGVQPHGPAGAAT